MLLQTYKLRPTAPGGGGVASCDAEYAGNVVVAPVPVDYWNTGTYVEGGTIGQGPVTATAITMEASPSTGAVYADTPIFDGGADMILLLDTNDWTVQPGFDREFMLGQPDYAGGNGSGTSDFRFVRADGTLRDQDFENNGSDFWTRRGTWFDVTDVCKTPDGILAVRFTMRTPNQGFYHFIYGPYWHGSRCRFSLARLN